MTNKLRACLAFVLLLMFTLPAFAQKGESEINPAPPTGISVDEIIQRFASKEKEFKAARERYTWRQSLKVQEMDGSTPTGEFQSEVDILFDDRGRRIEHVLFAPQPSLQQISMTKEDFDDLRQRLPFVLTADEIPLYDIKYVGQQRQDELNTYVFDINPKKMEKGQRYFEGRIWVDNHDLQIVKTHGKNVPDIIQKGGEENLFPPFTTWREQIDGKYWFPTYTRVDATLHFKATGDVHIRQIVKYTNYKRYGSDIKITYEGQDVEKADKDKQPQTQPDASQQQKPR